MFCRVVHRVYSQKNQHWSNKKKDADVLGLFLIESRSPGSTEGNACITSNRKVKGSNPTTDKTLHFVILTCYVFFTVQ